MASSGGAVTGHPRDSDWISEAVDELSGSFLITDPALPGHPIVFASRGFLALSGYSPGDVLGRNARIFQGPATDRRSVLEIREAIREERVLQISLLNYRKDGTPHWILFHLCPVFDDGRAVHFVAVQVPIRSLPTRLLPLGTCRGEVRADKEFGCGIDFLSSEEIGDRGLEVHEMQEVSTWERQKAVTTANDIISALTCYSKFTDRLVCGNKCSLPSVAPLSSSLTISLGRINQSFVLTDPHLHDMPIVYASSAFLSLTGYCSHEILGRNCRILNGLDTDAEVLYQITDSIRAQQTCTVRILNYRKNGSSFWSLLHISPVRNALGKEVQERFLSERGTKRGSHEYHSRTGTANLDATLNTR